MLVVLQKVIFIRVWQKCKMFKNRTLLEADPRHLPTAKMEQFVLKFTAESCILQYCDSEFHLKCC